MKFQKITIMLTLTCLCVFSIIGLVLNLNANPYHHDGQTYTNGIWTLGAHSYSTSSGACASISPYINGAGNPQAAVNYDYHGWGRAWAERDGYLSFNPFNWFDASPTDDGDLKARLKVVMADFTRDGVKVRIIIGAKLFKIISLSRTLEIAFGGSDVIQRLVKEEEKYVGRHANVGGGEDVSKSSGVCGIFDGVSFDHDTSYEPGHTH